MKKVILSVMMLALIVTIVGAATTGVKKKKPLPHEYGNVVMNNSSELNGIAPVVFNHWLHRSLYSCRLCHVDLAFAMEANATGVKEADNKSGYYCGACHNGKEAFGNVTVSSSGEQIKNCERCHSYGKKVVFEKDFKKYTAAFPTDRFGNKIDWVKAETDGKIHLKDFIEGVSIKRKPLAIPEDEEVRAKSKGMPSIVFSHKKHALWSGCELCHPDIFGVKKGDTKYSMQDIFNGKFCGACHDKVAFPNADCQKCHTEPVY